ncbi:MAG: radical SAM protein [Elusimicrobiota bacterium]
MVSNESGTEKQKRDWLKFLPGGIYTTSKYFGIFYLLKLIFRSAMEYIRTYFYILRVRGLKQAYSFFYTKFFVPAGEGAGAGIYFLLNPIVRRFPRLVPRPRYVEIEVTTICPRKCIMCEHTYWKDQEERHLSLDEFKHIVNEFKGIRWLHLTGEGSSFTNPDYPKMLRHAKDKFISVYLVDTLDMMDEEKLEMLVDIKLEGIYISLDAATKETYEKIRVGCNFYRVINNINKLLEIKRKKKSLLPEVSFRNIILTENVHEMPDFVKLIASFDTKMMGRGARLDFVGNLEFPEVKQYSVAKVPEEIIKATMENALKYNVNVFLSHIECKQNPSINQCIAWMEPYIIMGGYVMPCCNILMSNKRTVLREHAFGNIYKQSLSEIWNSERFRKFRDTITKPDAKVPFLCTMCRAYDFSERAKKYGVDETL